MIRDNSMNSHLAHLYLLTLLSLITAAWSQLSFSMSLSMSVLFHICHFFMCCSSTSDSSHVCLHFIFKMDPPCRGLPKSLHIMLNVLRGSDHGLKKGSEAESRLERKDQLVMCGVGWSTVESFLCVFLLWLKGCCVNSKPEFWLCCWLAVWLFT